MDGQSDRAYEISEEQLTKLTTALTTRPIITRPKTKPRSTEFQKKSYSRTTPFYVQNFWTRVAQSGQKLVCYYCHRKVSRYVKQNSPQRATIEHLIPLCRGGTHAPENLVLACYKCNHYRGMMDGKVLTLNIHLDHVMHGLYVTDPTPSEVWLETMRPLMDCGRMDVHKNWVLKKFYQVYDLGLEWLVSRMNLAQRLNKF